MKLTVEHFAIRSTDEVDSLIEERILALQPSLQIDEARVRLERRREVSPPIRVAVHLVTPGPDIHAEGHDHTIRAAIDKVMLALAEKIGVRNLRRARRVKGKVQEPAHYREGALAH